MVQSTHIPSALVERSQDTLCLVAVRIGRSLQRNALPCVVVLLSHQSEKALAGTALLRWIVSSRLQILLSLFNALGAPVLIPRRCLLQAELVARQALLLAEPIVAACFHKTCPGCPALLLHLRATQCVVARVAPGGVIAITPSHTEVLLRQVAVGR